MEQWNSNAKLLITFFCLIINISTLSKISTMRVIRIAIRSTCLSLFLGVFFTYEATAQVMPEYTCYIKYDHDAAGNRTAKYWYCCCGAETSGSPIDLVGSQKMASSTPVLEGLTLMLHPNPANAHLTITTSGPLEMATLEIYDMNGKMAISKPFTGSSLNVDVDELPRGAYAVRLVHNGEMLIKQLLIQ